MKKLLATLAVAPLAITACGGGDSSSGGGSSAKAITVFGSQYTQAEIDALFADNGAKVKEMIDNAGANPNIVKGLGIKTTSEANDVYSFTNVDGSTVTEKIEADAFNAFAAAAKNTKVSATPASWKNALKIGQHQKYGTTAPSNEEVRAAADYQVKALGTADVNTVLTIPALGNEFSAFAGNNYTNTLLAAVAGGTVDHTEARFTIAGHAPGAGSAYQTAKDLDIGSFDAAAAAATWKVHSAGGDYQTINQGKLYTSNTGINGALTHTTSFMSWYLEDFTDHSGANALAGGYITIKLAIFKPSGEQIRDVATIEIPKIKVASSSAVVTANQTFLASSLFTPLNVGTRSTSVTVKTAGSAIVDPGFAKGVALHNPAADEYIYFSNDLAATTNLPDLTNLHFSVDGPVKAAFKAWLNASTFGTVTKTTSTVQTWEWYGALVDPQNNGTGWNPVKYSSKDEIYKNICIQAQAMYKISTSKTEATWTCPTA